MGFCGIYLQPSEPLKLLLIAYLAAYLADRMPVSFSLAQLLSPTLILIGAALILLIGQRDLGTASLFILIYTVVVYLASQRNRLIGISLVILALAGVTGYLLFDVVRIRVDAWIDPWLDPAGRSYQIVQSIIAIANGQVLGRGPGLGSPGVVPVSHSDFIFASIAEESGLLGSVALLGLFALLVGRGFRAAIYASNNYSRYLAAGITA
ncbi:MAG: FtsW/RodA/SpoVE family cell cycle protein [Chloroflexi bacterium]|nr:MAG: FtsW/RodA/SpoVE family cell cycle protein [Chloroflexota bacterium]